MRKIGSNRMAIAAAFLLAACGDAGPTGKTVSGETVVLLPKAPLDIEAQAARIAACNDRLLHYRALGVWAHGGVRPGVVRAAWDRLSDEERDEIFALAACEASGGQVQGDVSVTVTEEGGYPEIETRVLSTRRDFVGEAQR